MKREKLWSLLALCFYLFAGTTLFTACGDDDDDDDIPGQEVPVNQPTYDSNLTRIIPEEMLNKLSQYIPIHQGTTPSSVEGSYFYVPTVVIDETNSYEKGYAMAREILRLSGQNTSRRTITVEKKYRSGETSKSSGALLLGNGADFTIVFTDEGDQYGIHYKTANVISGTKSSDGLTNLYEALIMVENDDPIGTKLLPVGKCRVFSAWNNIATNSDWDANVWGN